jgi:type IV pilus assembly protein PilV
MYSLFFSTRQRRRLGGRCRGISSRRQSAGMALLEVLVSILLFSLGIVAFIGFQANALTLTGKMDSRAELARVTETYIGQMWGTGADINQIRQSFTTGSNGTPYQLFVQDVQNALPGADADNVNGSVTLTADDNTPPRRDWVNILIEWNDARNEKVAASSAENSGAAPGFQHRYSQVAGIGL